MSYRRDGSMALKEEETNKAVRFGPFSLDWVKLVSCYTFFFLPLVR